MSTRIPWSQHEIALLFDAYIRVAEGADFGKTAEWLSLTLRKLATQSGQAVDETYRNVNGMKMQLANVQYMFTDGQKGLSGASARIRQMYALYRTDYTEYQTILKEALQMTERMATTVEEAFFAYTKEQTALSPKILVDCLKKAEEYCHLKQPLLGMTDVRTVRNAQQKISEDTLLRFRYGKNAQTIRTAVQLYYTFIKSYREPKEEPYDADAEWLIRELHAKKLRYVDNRSSDGHLWIASDMNIPISLNDAFKHGYRLRFKQDGCPAFPDRPVLWTKDQPQQPKPVLPGRGNNLHGLDDFRTFLVQHRQLAERTANNYWTSIRMIEGYIQQNALPYSLVNATAGDVQSVVDTLMSRPDFVRINDERHHQYSAAMAQYVSYLRNRTQMTESASGQKQMALSDLIIDNVVTMEANDSLLAEIRKRILSFVSDSFPHGIRPASVIDINKLKRSYQIKFGEALPADIDMVSLLTSEG